MSRRGERVKEILRIVQRRKDKEKGRQIDTIVSAISVAKVDCLEVQVHSGIDKLQSNCIIEGAELTDETTNDDDNDDVTTKGSTETNIITFEPMVESDSRKGGRNAKYSIKLQYSLDDLLGTGGFSNCYVASDVTDTSNKYALKILKENSLKAKLSCKNEFNIHTSFRSHPNIVKCFGMIKKSPSVGLVLELCSEKKNLKDLISYRKKLTIEEIYYYLPQIINAVAYLHENLIIHRDLKLTNVLIASSLQIKIADFGLAVHLQSKEEKCKHAVGTPSYAAPEMIKAKKDGDGYSFPVDVWSIGIMTYALLFGSVPFQGHNTESTFQKIISGELVFPVVAIHPLTKDIIKRLLCPTSLGRPSAVNIMNEPFFTNRLDESSLNDVPLTVF